MGLLDFFRSSDESAGGAERGLADLPPAPAIAPAAFSSRSQRSLVEQIKVQENLERCEAFARITREQLRGQEEFAKYQVGNAVSGEGFADYMLPKQLAAVEDMRKKLQAYEDHAAALRSKLSALSNPSEAEVEERRERQYRLARLANLRLRLDCEIDSRLEGLQRLLNERVQLTAGMMQEAEAIQLTCPNDYFDQTRFDVLSATLPRGVAEKSESWLRWFFGKKKREGTDFTVKEKFIALPETLAASNVFVKGQQILLASEEAKGLGKAVGPAIPAPGGGPQSGGPPPSP